MCVMERVRALTHASLLRRSACNLAEEHPISLDILSSAILLVVATAASWPRLNTVATNILGFVSSSTRDSFNLNLSTEGSIPNGRTPARMLNHVLHVKVKLAEVSGQSG